MKSNRTTIRARDKKGVLVRLDDVQQERFDSFKTRLGLDESNQIAGIALFEFGIAAFERGEFVLPEQPVKHKVESY